MSFFVLDIETLDIRSTAAVLQIGMVYVEDVGKPRTYEDIINSGIYLKLDIVDQIKRLKRTTSQETIDWWKKQGAPQREVLRPDPKNDMRVEDALDVLTRWIKSKPKNLVCWARGTLDSVVIDDLCRSTGTKSIFEYNDYRDVRTGLDMMYPNSKNGYVDIDPELCIGFNLSHVLKHHPTHDAAFDAAMLMFGKA